MVLVYRNDCRERNRWTEVDTEILGRKRREMQRQEESAN